MAKLGSQLIRLQTVSSTNDLAKEMALSGSEEGLAIVSQHQTAGRGRMGRSWSSPAGEGLYLSVILRPRVEPARASIITLAAAVAVAETLSSDFSAKIDIKWPNDVLAGGRKICGILVESSVEGNELLYAILGIGLNLAQREFPPELRGAATSLLLESGRRVSADDALPPLLERLDHYYRLSITSPPEIISRWEGMSSYARDCRVTITSHDSVIEATTRGLSERGGLLVEMPGGEIHEIISGEVSLRRDGEPR